MERVIINTLISTSINKRKAQVMNRSFIPNSNEINELGRIDCKFGLLPAVATIKAKMNDENKNYFNFNNFLSQMRQYMILLESYSGIDYDKVKSDICNITAPDFLLFEKPVKIKNLPKDFVKRIYSSLTEQYLESHTSGGKGNRCHIVIKKKDTISNQHYVVEELQRALGLPSQGFNGPIHIRNKPIPCPESFLKRIDWTNKFENIITKQVENQSTNPSDKKQGEAKEFMSFLKCEKVFPLFGKIREFPDQEVLYLMCYYKISKKLELEVVNKYLDSHLPNIIQNNAEIRDIIKQCGKTCKPSSHQCFISKLLARKNGSDGVCAVFFVVFSKEVKRSKQGSFPIKQMYEYIKRELNNWQVYMNRLDNFQFPI